MPEQKNKKIKKKESFKDERLTSEENRKISEALSEIEEKTKEKKPKRK